MLLVRRESRADVDAIYALHSASFPTPAEARLVDALRAAGRLAISLVAVEQDRVMGHVAFSPITVDGVPLGLGLGPVAVQLDCRRRGVAAQVIRQGLALCREAAAGLVVVLGDPRYYARFGFEPARRLALQNEHAWDDAFQAIELDRARVCSKGGLVRYAPEFATLGG
jgi:putative acetyltransferase